MFVNLKNMFTAKHRVVKLLLVSKNVFTTKHRVVKLLLVSIVVLATQITMFQSVFTSKSTASHEQADASTCWRGRVSADGIAEHTCKHLQKHAVSNNSGKHTVDVHVGSKMYISGVSRTEIINGNSLESAENTARSVAVPANDKLKNIKGINTSTLILSRFLNISKGILNDSKKVPKNVWQLMAWIKTNYQEYKNDPGVWQVIKNSVHYKTDHRKGPVRNYSVQYGNDVRNRSAQHKNDIKNRTQYKAAFRERVINNLQNYNNAFRERVTGRNIRILLDVVDAFSGTLRRAGIPYFMYGGTLLGSWRHHGLVPWDDDVDMAVPYALHEWAYRALNDLKPHFLLDVRQKTRWKFYSIMSHPIRGVTWCWPFVDVNFYQENDTHIWDRDILHYRDFVFSSLDVFPLQDRPFMGRMLPAPRDTKAVLSRSYSLLVCKVGSYNHFLESLTSASDLYSVLCEKLYSVYPFVSRVSLGKAGCNETLRLNNKVLSWSIQTSDEC